MLKCSYSLQVQALTHDRDALALLKSTDVSNECLLQLLQRLLEDRKPSMETMMSEGPLLAEGIEGEEGEKTRQKLSDLQLKWDALRQSAENRSGLHSTTSQTNLIEFQSGRCWCEVGANWRLCCFVKPGWLCFVVLCRRASLALILPMAQLFQESTDRLQLWLISVEQDLAELRSAERGMLHLQEATEQAKVRKEKKKSRV